MIYVISDTHFNHENIIEYTNRPFETVNEMNQTIIDNWNKTVGENDLVIHLGDFALCNDRAYMEIMQQLKGKIVLLRGNHDNRGKSKYIQKFCFEEVFQREIVLQTRKEEKLEFKEILMTHRPIDKEVLEERGFDLNIHGHTHNTSNIDDIYWNVSVENIEYTPQKLELYTPYRFAGK